MLAIYISMHRFNFQILEVNSQIITDIRLQYPEDHNPTNSRWWRIKAVLVVLGLEVLARRIGAAE